MEHICQRRHVLRSSTALDLGGLDGSGKAAGVEGEGCAVHNCALSHGSRGVRDDWVDEGALSVRWTQVDLGVHAARQSTRYAGMRSGQLDER